MRYLDSAQNIGFYAKSIIFYSFYWMFINAVDTISVILTLIHEF